MLAIYAKNRIGPDPAEVEKAVEKALERYAIDVASQLAKYPPQVPPINTASHTFRGGVGVRVTKAGNIRYTRPGFKTAHPYRRTGDYGRFWTAPGSMKTQVSSSSASVTVTNKVSRKGHPYAVYVGGPKDGSGPGQRQARVMGDRGWPNMTDAIAGANQRNKGIVGQAMLGHA